MEVARRFVRSPRKIGRERDAVTHHYNRRATTTSNFAIHGERARIYLLEGGRDTDCGAKQNSRKIELQARLYF